MTCAEPLEAVRCTQPKRLLPYKDPLAGCHSSIGHTGATYDIENGVNVFQESVAVDVEGEVAAGLDPAVGVAVGHGLVAEIFLVDRVRLTTNIELDGGKGGQCGVRWENVTLRSFA